MTFLERMRYFLEAFPCIKAAGHNHPRAVDIGYRNPAVWVDATRRGWYAPKEVDSLDHNPGGWSEDVLAWKDCISGSRRTAASNEAGNPMAQIVAANQSRIFEAPLLRLLVVFLGLLWPAGASTYLVVLRSRSHGSLENVSSPQYRRQTSRSSRPTYLLREAMAIWDSPLSPTSTS
jgi:hypothetical protein